MALLNKKILISFISILFVLIGCNNSEEPRTVSENSNGSITKISNTKPINQSITNEAKEYVLEKDEVTEIRGVNTEKDMLMAIVVKPLQQFNEQDIESEVKKSLEKKYPQKKIEVSSDKKIFIELNKLEKEIEKDDLNQKELEKRFNKIKKLINDPA